MRATYTTMRTSGDQGNWIDSLNGQFIADIPAPLPILGAFAAFGWSRKLRRRIRDANRADQAAATDMALAA